MAGQAEPDNLFIIAAIGHALSESGKYEEALPVFFKVMYNDEQNLSILRPLAWCAFMAGKLEVARQTFEKIVAVKPDKNDYMQFAHVLWVSGMHREAINTYQAAFRESNFDTGWFRKSMARDSKLINTNATTGKDIPLLIDYVVLFTTK